MGLTGGTTTGWILISQDPRMEYREVSTDGTEENTKQQKREHRIVRRFENVCMNSGGPFGWTSELDDSVISPTTLDGVGQTWTHSGTYYFSQDSYAPGGQGSSTMVGTQTLELFTTWEDV